MKLLKQVDITKIDPFFTESKINHYRKMFIFTEPCERLNNKTPVWSGELASKSMEKVYEFKSCGGSHKKLSDDLKAWIEKNKKANNKKVNLSTFDLAMKLMIAR